MSDDQLGMTVLLFISSGHLEQQQEKQFLAGCCRHCIDLHKHACMLTALRVQLEIVYV